jgi:hypothetical protein
VHQEERSRLITKVYREGTSASSSGPVASRSGPLVQVVADALSRDDGADGAAMKTARIVHNNPAKVIAAITSFATMGGLWFQKRSSSLTGSQRIMHMRVYLQAMVVFSAASVMGLSKVVEFSDSVRTSRK